MLGRYLRTRSRPADPGAGERVPHARRDVHEVGEDLYLQPGLQGVLDQQWKVRVQGRLPADELHHLHAQVRALVDHALPVGRAHHAMTALRARLRIAMDAFQPALAHNLQPRKVQICPCE